MPFAINPAALKSGQSLTPEQYTTYKQWAMAGAQGQAPGLTSGQEAAGYEQMLNTPSDFQAFSASKGGMVSIGGVPYFKSDVLATEEANRSGGEAQWAQDIGGAVKDVVSVGIPLIAGMGLYGAATSGAAASGTTAGATGAGTAGLTTDMGGASGYLDASQLGAGIGSGTTDIGGTIGTGAGMADTTGLADISGLTTDVGGAGGYTGGMGATTGAGYIDPTQLSGGIGSTDLSSVYGTTGASTTGGGINWGQLGSALSKLGKDTGSAITGAAGTLGPMAMIYDAYRQMGQPVPGAADLQATAQPALSAANQMIPAAAAGKLTQPQQAAVDQMVQQQTEAADQYLSQAGISDSSTAVGMHNQIKQNAVAMSQQFISQTMSQGLQALGLAQGPYEAIVQDTAMRDVGLQQAIANAFGAWGLMMGRSNGGGSSGGGNGGGSSILSDIGQVGSAVGGVSNIVSTVGSWF